MKSTVIQNELSGAIVESVDTKIGQALDERLH